MPLVIKLPFTAAALKQARVADTAELAVFYYDTSLLAWVEVEIDSIDPANRTVSFRTNHFSTGFIKYRVSLVPLKVNDQLFFHIYQFRQWVEHFLTG